MYYYFKKYCNNTYYSRLLEFLENYGVELHPLVARPLAKSAVLLPLGTVNSNYKYFYNIPELIDFVVRLRIKFNIRNYFIVYTRNINCHQDLRINYATICINTLQDLVDAANEIIPIISQSQLNNIIQSNQQKVLNKIHHNLNKERYKLDIKEALRMIKSNGINLKNVDSHTNLYKELRKLGNRWR